MKTSDFRSKLTSAKVKENLSKMFGTNVTLEKYSREQLEDMRNKIRTRMFQQEGQAAFNDLVTNETYQKDKAMLALLNTRIKEMLGEDIAKLRDKIKQLEEAKKGVRAPKYTKKAKGTDQTGDGKSDFDDVQVARMVAGGVPKKKAIAKATGDKFTEGSKEDYDYYFGKDKPDSGIGKTKELSKHTATKTASGTQYTKRDLPGQDTADDADEKARKRKEKKMREAAEEKCNHTPKDEKCPVHGLKECGTMEGKEKPSAGMSKAEKSAVVKKAKAGGDIGKKGKGFKDVEAAAKKGGAKNPKAVAAAAMWKQQAKKESQEIFRRHVRIVNESIAYLLQEDEEGKAKAITAAGDMVNDFTSWMQRVGQYQTKSMIELADAIRADFGAAEAEAFKQSVAPALSTTLEILTQQREAISNAVAVLAGEATPTEPMGMEPGMDAGMEPGMDATTPDAMNAPGDEFGAADAAAGGPEAAGREMRESRFQQKLAESHSIIAKLAR